MASVYPNNPDAIARTTPSDPLTGHSDLHDLVADAIENIQAFVGVQGDTTAGTVVKRIADLEGKDITVTFDTGSDLSGSFTITNLGNVTNTTVAVRDDSHNHTIGNVDNLQTTLDGKSATSHVHSGTYDLTPTGTISMFAGATAPTGWLLCDGTDYSRTTYAALFAVCGTTYGSAGSTTFKVPDLRGKVGMGVSGTTYTRGSSYGATTDSVTIASGNLPKHQHTLNGHDHSLNGHTHGVSGTTAGPGIDIVQRQGTYITASSAGVSYRIPDQFNNPTTVGMQVQTSYRDHTHTFSTTSGASTGSTGTNSGNTSDGGFANTALTIDTIQPSLAVNYIIKT